MNQRRLRFLNHFNNALKVLLCGLLLYIAMDLLAVVLVSPSTPLGLGSSFSWSWGITTPIVFAILCRFGWTRGLALISVGSLIGWRVFIPLVNPDFGSGVGVAVVLAVFIDLPANYLYLLFRRYFRLLEEWNADSKNRPAKV